MNQSNYIGIALDELYRIFNILNTTYFKNNLPIPMITIQKAKSSGNLGWFTLDPLWEDQQNEEKKYEINICAEYLNRELHEIVCTLQHEMIHYANKIADIRDCNGQVHNKKFKSLAESVGLVVEKSKKYGYGHTVCSEDFKDFIDNEIKPNAECFMCFRNIILVSKESKLKEKKIFNYTCQMCGEKVKAKRDKKILCIECSCQFEMEEE